MNIERAHAEKMMELLDHGLVSGVGEPIPGRMCVEAAICFALGLPHGDDPGCVSAPLRRLKIRLNDSSWSSNAARAEGLRRLAVAQLGSLGVLDDAEFRCRVVDVTIRKVVPLGLRATATRNPKHAEALEAAAVRCEQEGTREAAQNGERVARAVADAYDAAYAYEAAEAVVAAYAAAYAADAAADVAVAAYYAAAYAAEAAAEAADDAEAQDRVLSQFAEWVVEILIDMNAPGCQWLDLAPKKVA